MRYALVLVLTALLMGATVLRAEPDDDPPCPLHLDSEVQVPEAQVEALMKGLKAKPPWQLQVAATFLRVDAEHADRVLDTHRPDRKGSARAIPYALAERLLGTVRRGAVRPEPLPPLVLFAGQTGRLRAGGRHLYLQDYEVEGGNSWTVTPLVGAIRDGACVEVTPERTTTGLQLDVRTCWADTVRPIPPFTTTLHPDYVVTIQLPEMRLVQGRHRAALPAEGGFLLAGHGHAWDGETLRLAVLEVRPPKR